MSLLILPSELLIQVLDHFPTPSLLPLTTVSSRVHDIICRIIRNRLLTAALVPDHILFFDCFHPTLRFTQPSLHCRHLATQHLDSRADTEHGEAAGSSMTLISDGSVLNSNAGAHLSHLRGLRSCYKPFHRQQTPRRPPRPGDIPGSRTFDPTASIASVTTHPNAPVSTLAGPSNAEAASVIQQAALPIRTTHQTLHLDPGELFTQLVLQVNVVSSRPGLFRSFIQVCDGVVRVWREWLVGAAAATSRLDEAIELGLTETESGMEARTLWVAPDQDVGLLVRVRRVAGPPRGWAVIPFSAGSEEEDALSYDLEFEGKLPASEYLEQFST
jgi:hypothetical protein